MPAKQVLFELNSGTAGDQKPLALLAVHAAHALSHITASYPPIILLVYDWLFIQWLYIIEEYANYRMGSQWRQWLDIQKRYPPLSSEERKRYIIFACSNHDILLGMDQTIYLDFGDNIGKNRFTSTLLSFKKTSSYFGSIYLPILSDTFWSPLPTIHTFFKHLKQWKGKKLVTMAGSLRPPFTMEEIEQWCLSHPHSTWGFCLLGYPQPPSSLPENMFVISEMIQYEDIIGYTDFFITNCGAGSVGVALAAGIPQLCQRRGTIGGDKLFNEEIVSEK